MGEVSPKIYRFGPFESDFEQRLLLCNGDSIPLTPKAFVTLEVLVARQGKVVDKAELLTLLWPDTFVEENNLTQHISVLRKVFGEGDYIETIPRRGYRFLMSVQDVIAPEIAAEPGPLSAPVRGHRSWWIWGVLAVAAVAVLALYASRRIRDLGQSDHRVDSLVVLPFVN